MCACNPRKAETKTGKSLGFTGYLMSSRPVRDPGSKTEQTNNKKLETNKENERVGSPWGTIQLSSSGHHAHGMHIHAHVYKQECTYVDTHTWQRPNFQKWRPCAIFGFLCPDSNHALCKLGLTRTEQTCCSSNFLWVYCPSLQVTPVWTMPPTLGLQHFRRKIKVCSERSRADSMCPYLHELIWSNLLLWLGATLCTGGWWPQEEHGRP